SSYNNKCPREDSLRECFNKSSIKGSINFRNEFAYNGDLSMEYNARVIYFPVAFVHPIDVLDVQNAIKCGSELNFPVVARSGGHSYESYSIGDGDCYLIIDLVNLKDIAINTTTQTAVIGTGNTLESFYFAVNKYVFAFPAGGCPGVGVGGHIMGGGQGLLNRKFGVSSDNILDAEIVLANGTVIHSVKEYPELLWAIRGAGNAGYGIITSLTLKIHPIQKIVSSVLFTYDFNQIPLVYSVMSKIADNLHQNLSFVINHLPLYKIYVRGVFLGPTNELQNHVQEFIKLTEPKIVTYTEGDWFNMTIDYTDSLETRSSFKAKSFFVNLMGISDEGVKYLMKFVASYKCLMTFESLVFGGGRVNEVMRNETAFVHRGFMYSILIKANTTISETCLEDLEIFSKYFQKTYTSYESYQNLIDRKLDHWQCRYYRENFKKLVEIKQQYDPYNLFHWNQSIPIETNISC
ncbi:2694_t:CDS:2, partial [Scutellospora calospora]